MLTDSAPRPRSPNGRRLSCTRPPHVYQRRYCVREDDPTSASAEIKETIELGRDDWQPRIETRIRLTSTRKHWRLQADLDAYEGDDRCFCRSWDETIERDHM